MRIVDVAGGADLSPSKRARTEAAAAAERPVLRFAKLSEHATTPTRGSAKAAGYDLYRLVKLHMHSMFHICPRRARCLHACTKIRPRSVACGNIMKLVIWLYNL